MVVKDPGLIASSYWLVVNMRCPERRYSVYSALLSYNKIIAMNLSTLSK